MKGKQQKLYSHKLEQVLVLDAVVDALHRHGHLPKDPHFVATVAELLTLKILHLQS